MARRRDLARRQRLRAGVQAGQARRPAGADRQDQEERHEDHVQAGRPDIRRRSSISRRCRGVFASGVPQQGREDHDRRRADREVARVPVQRRASRSSCGTSTRTRARSIRSPSTSSASRTAITVEVAIQYNDSYNETVYSFANNINTIDGGTHLSGFRAALTRTINNYGQSCEALQDGEAQFGPLGRRVREGLVAVVSVKIPQPQFEGQTKTKLGNREVKGIVETFANDAIGEFFEQNPAVARKIISEVRRRRACARGGSQSTRPHAPQGRARLAGTCPESSPTAPSRTRRCPSCTWSRATRPAARPSRGATGDSRRSCRSRARS